MDNKSKEAKKYNNIKLGIGITKGIISFILVTLFVYFGYSNKLVELISFYTNNTYLQFILFTIAIGFISSLLFAPVKYYTGFYLEHKYDLSNQTFLAWIWEGTKGVLVGGVIGLPILLLFFWVLNSFGDLWWLVFATFMFFISVILAQLVPIVIIPIFYKVSPIEDEELKGKIVKLANKVGMNVENVFKFDMSKNTKKANAAFTGLGKTKRIILGDTLLDGYSHDQIETVMAHELGHYKYKHIVKNLIIGTIFSFLTFYLIAVIYKFVLPYFGFSSIVEIAALPLLTLIGMLIGLIQQPISNIISRIFEYQADEYAIKSTNKRESFISTLEKLTDQNLGDKEPHPFVEWFFYSHPSIKNRINYINSIKL